MTERSLYNDTNINITTSRLIIHTNKNNVEQTITYAIRNITSVKKTTVEYAKGWAILTILIGVYFLFIALGTIGEESLGINLGAIIFSLIIIVSGVSWATNCKPTHNVIIISSAGEGKVIISQNEAYVEKIVDTINDAISSYQ